MKKYLFAALAIALGAGFSAFTVPAKAKASKTTFFFYYTFGGAQTQAGRSNGANYTNPQSTDPGNCSSGSDECVLEVQISTSTPPANVSGLTINYDPTTGIPTSGANYKSNETEL